MFFAGNRPQVTGVSGGSAPRILIVRLSAIGDVIQSMPLAGALRDRFPKASIVWVASTHAATLLEGHSAIDQVIGVPRHFLRLPSVLRTVVRQLRAFRFDVAIDGQGLAKSAILARLSGAKRRIGFGKPWGRELSRWINSETVDTHSVHAVDRNMELLRPLGIESPRVRFDVPECPTSAHVMQRFLEESRVHSEYALINVGAGWPSKVWPAQRYAAVASYLGTAWNIPLAVGVWRRGNGSGGEVVPRSAGNWGVQRLPHRR